MTEHNRLAQHVHLTPYDESYSSFQRAGSDRPRDEHKTDESPTEIPLKESERHGWSQGIFPRERASAH